MRWPWHDKKDQWPCTFMAYGHSSWNDSVLHQHTFAMYPREQCVQRCTSCAAGCRVLVQGAGPSARYAHTLSLVANRFLVAMGGNDGKATLGDAWALDTSEKPYQWRKITDAGDMPCPRYAQGMSCAAAGRSAAAGALAGMPPVPAGGPCWAGVTSSLAQRHQPLAGGITADQRSAGRLLLQDVCHCSSALGRSAAAVWWPRRARHAACRRLRLCAPQGRPLGVARSTRQHALRALPARLGVCRHAAAHIWRCCGRRSHGRRGWAGGCTEGQHAAGT